MPAATPRWQSWKPEGRPNVSWADYTAAIADASTRLIAASRGCASRWNTLIPHLHTLPEANRSEALRALRSDIPGFSPEERELLWHALRDLVNSHRAYSKADWALNPAAVDEIEELLPLLVPVDPVARAGWLFDKHPKIDEELDWQARETKLEERRKAVIC